MYLIIGGCGRLGSLVVNEYYKEHEIVVIDKDKSVINRLPADYNGGVVIGDLLDEEVLLTAQIERADVIIAATDNDKVNLMFAQMAKQIYKIHKVIVRINDPQLARIYKEEFNIETISPIIFLFEEIKKFLSNGQKIKETDRET